MMDERVRDTSVCVALFLGTFAYLHFWPHDLYPFDEGLFLYEGKRILDGEVMYRDFFEILTPGSHYVMAGLYALFGVSMETARTGMAVLHSGIAVLIYFICRRLGARRALALAAAIVHPAICYPALTIASAHWFGTGAATVLYLLVLCRAATTRGRSFVWGVAAGIPIVVEQHRGAVMAVAAAAMLVMDHVLEQRSGTSRQADLAGKAAAYTAGVLGVVLPVLLAFVAVAGFDAVFRALVRHPLDNYRRIVRDVPWGAYLSVSLGIPFLLKYLPPVFIPAAAVRAAWQWVAGANRAQQRPLLVAVIFSGFAVLAIAYLPDALHLALAGPIWFPVVAESLERLARLLERAAGASQIPGNVIAFLLLAALALQSRRNMEVQRSRYPFPHQTVFGRVDFASQEDVDRLNWLVQLLRDAGAREIFVYPCYPALYLLTQTHNPTRYQIVLPRGYTDRDQIEEIIATLEARRVPFVVRNLYVNLAGIDLLPAYLQRHYRPLKFPGERGGVPALAVSERTPD